MRKAVQVGATARVDPDAVEAVVWPSKALHPVIVLRSGALVHADKEANESREDAVERLTRLIVDASHA